MLGLEAEVILTLKEKGISFDLKFVIGKEGNYYSSDGMVKPEYGELAELTGQLAGEIDEDIDDYGGSLGVLYTKM
jgi:hypothetical protein